MVAMLRKALIGAGTASIAAIVLVGVAHTRIGRPLLGWMKSGGGGCPVLSGTASPERVEAYRIQELRRIGADRDPAGTPALGFILGSATRQDVSEWVRASAATCTGERADSVLRCSKVGTEAAATGAPSLDGVPLEDLYVQFDPAGRLVAVDAFRHGRTTDAAVAYLTDLEGYLRKTVGPPTSATSPRSAVEVDAHPFERVEFQHHYRNYMATVSVMNYGRGVVRIREQYQWAPASG
jgi:hypothetical protein